MIEPIELPYDSPTLNLMGVRPQHFDEDVALALRLDGLGFVAEGCKAIFNERHTLPFRVLDIGCGLGNAVQWFARRGCAVTGMDIATEFLAIAQDRINSEKFEHTPVLLQADARLLCAADLTEFDLVVLTNVGGLQSDVGKHLLYLARAMGELAPLLLVGVSKIRGAIDSRLQDLSEPAVCVIREVVTREVVRDTVESSDSQYVETTTTLLNVGP